MSSYAQSVIEKLNDLLPELDPKLASLYALLALVKGRETTLNDVHDAWSLWRVETQPDHASIVPFDQLTVTVQELDRKYMEAIHAAASPCLT